MNLWFPQFSPLVHMQSSGSERVDQETEQWIVKNELNRKWAGVGSDLMGMWIMAQSNIEKKDNKDVRKEKFKCKNVRVFGF